MIFRLFADNAEPNGILGVGNIKIDEVNLILGQTVLYGPRLTMDKYFGLQYVRVEVGMNTSFIGTLDGSDTVPIVGETLAPLSAETSKFNGIGMVVGLDAEYDLNFWDLSLVGMAQGSLIAGQMKLESRSAFQPDDGEGDVGAIVLTDTFKPYSDRTIVPAGKLRGALRWTWETTYDGILTFDVGYQWTGYFNVVRRPIASGVLGAEGDRPVDSAGFHGMIFGLKWLAAV